MQSLLSVLFFTFSALPTRTIANTNEPPHTAHLLHNEYPNKFKMHRDLTVANVIPDQYIVVMNRNRTHISTQPLPTRLRRLYPAVSEIHSTKSTTSTTSTEQVNNLLSALLDGSLDNEREGDFRVMVDNVYTYVFDGFSATLSPLAARFVLDDPNVESVEPNMLASIADAQRNPSWNLDRIDQSSSRLDRVFDTGSLNGAGVSIYILDTGVNPNHNDFAGRVENSVDFVKDGNGPRDCNGHGTHCASTALGTRWGVAKKALLNSVRVLGCNGSGSWSGILSGLDWSVQNIVRKGRIGVISMSLGGQKSSILDRAVASAVRQGAMVVVAAGNEDSNACNTSPANEPLAVAVGASTQSDQRASFSNFGRCVDIYAPGVSIRAASHLSDTGTTLLSGTSMACPHVSGASALEIQKMRRNNQPSTPTTVRNALLQSATRGVMSNLRGGPNLLLRVPVSNRAPNPAPRFPTPLPFPSPPSPSPSNCRTTDFTPCVFPFVFRGVEYTSCTTDHDPNGQAWCSTRTDPNTNKHISGFWGVCDKQTCEPVCAMKTERGDNCVFPFVYKNVVHAVCTTVDDPLNKPWCSTQVEPRTNQHVSGRWGHCVLDCPDVTVAPTGTPTFRPVRPTPTPNRPRLPTPPNRPTLPTPNRPTLPTPNHPTPPISIPPVDCELLDAINDVRALNNLPALVMDRRLYLAAQKHAIDMGERNYFSHVSPTGSTPAQRVQEEGYRWRSVAENIAAGYSGVTDVVNGWVNSPGHFGNIKCTQCTRTGIAKIVVEGSQWTSYYVQVFASGDDAREDIVSCDPSVPQPFPLPSPVQPPVQLPTPRPTPRPTPFPTLRPTPFPTLRPTARPTRFPTRIPTNLPTPAPQQTPSNLPTPAPQPQPTPPTNPTNPTNPINPNAPIQDDDTLDNIDATCKTLPSVDAPARTCVFPFVYKSVLYTRCTVADHNRPWCATATNSFGQFINGNWGVCDLEVCEIGGESCQLHTLNAPWSNAETKTFSMGHHQHFHTTTTTTTNQPQEQRGADPQNDPQAPCLTQANHTDTSPHPTTTEQQQEKKWSLLLIGTICSVVLNVVLFGYAIGRDTWKRASPPISQPCVRSGAPTKYDTPRASISSVTSSASL